MARTDNLHVLWGLLVLAGLGIGGIVVPASIITTIICPDVSATPSESPIHLYPYLHHVTFPFEPIISRQENPLHQD